MASLKSLKDHVASLRRRFAHVSPERFLYNKPAELAKRYKKINVWFLITDEGVGASVQVISFTRSKKSTVSTWKRAFTEAGVVGEFSIMGIYTQKILPAMNAKGGRDWKFSAVIGWTGIHEDRKAKAKNPSPSRRDKNADE